MFVRSMLMLALVLGTSGRALAQEGVTPPPPGPAEVPPPAVEVAPPQPAPQGQWVNTAEYGWVWIPLGTVTQAVGGLPYAYLYTPAHGWTWYASPWGWGRFALGGWVARPAPYGYRAWVRGPRGWAWYHGPRASIRYVVPHPALTTTFPIRTPPPLATTAAIHGAALITEAAAIVGDDDESTRASDMRRCSTTTNALRLLIEA